MKKISVTIVPGEPAMSAEVFETQRVALTRSRKVLGKVNTVLGLVAIVGLVIHAFPALKAAVTPTVADAMYAIGFIGFCLGHSYEKALGRRIDDVSSIPENLLAEAAGLCHMSATATAYLAGVRAQKRELMLVELEAVRSLVADMPAPQARQILYGSRVGQ